MSKKLMILMMLLMAAALVLVGCGGDEEAATPEATEEPMVEATDEPMVEPTDEPMAEPEISLTIWADDTRAPILLSLAEEFQASTGVALVVEQVADIRDQFTIAAPAGEGPDIIIGAHDWIGQLISSGLLAPIDLGAKAGDFTDVSLTGFTYDGQLYGMPYAVENLAFFRNTDMVPEAPATWDEVVSIGEALAGRRHRHLRLCPDRHHL